MSTGWLRLCGDTVRHEITASGDAFALRPAHIDDAEFILGLRTNPLLNRFLNPTSPRLDDQISWMLRQQDQQGDYLFIVERLTDTRREGVISIYNLDSLSRSAEWGRWVMSPGSVGALESAAMIYRVGFENLGLDMLYCRTIAENRRVVAFHTSCGLVTSVERSGMTVLGDTPHAFVEQQMTRQTWEQVGPELLRRASMAARLARR